MKIGNIEIISPRVFPNETYSEAEILGSMAWLWSHFGHYKDASVESALNVILPIIRSQNFALFIENQQPIGYANWAYLDTHTAQMCKQMQLSYEELIQHSSPEEGKELWVLSFFCLPSERNHFAMQRLLTKHVFKGQKIHFAYHKSNNTQARFYTKQC